LSLYAWIGETNPWFSTALTAEEIEVVWSDTEGSS